MFHALYNSMIIIIYGTGFSQRCYSQVRAKKSHKVHLISIIKSQKCQYLRLVALFWCQTKKLLIIIKMSSNLLKAHQLITQIERNFQNQKKLRQSCTELQDLIEYIDENSQYHYLLFLVEVYGAKLRDYSTAELLCKKVIKDGRSSVELEGTLRMCFLNALQRKYPQAIKNLEYADTLSQQKIQLQTIFLNFFSRMLVHSKQSNLLQAARCQEMQKHQQAIQYYNLEFEAEDLQNPQIENKYYAAKSILQLLGIFPNHSRGIDTSKYNIFLQELYDEKDEKEDSSFLSQVDHNYKNQKDYLKKVVNCVFIKENNIRKGKPGTKNNPIKFHNELEQRRLLAILKLQKVMKHEDNLNVAIRTQFQKSIHELRHNTINNYSMLSQFTAEEFKRATKGTELIKKMLRKPIFDYIRNIYLTQSSNKLKAKRQSLFQNMNTMEGESPTRFTKHPLQNSIQSGLELKIRQIKSQENSQIQAGSNFTGSYMEKINENSSGHEKRYFYFVKNQLDKGKFKLYYNDKQSKISKDDYYYDLKHFKGITEGKTTKALNRSECKNFDERQCFSILLQDKKTRNFYVPDKKDYQNWIRVFRKYEADSKIQKKVSVSTLNNQQQPSQSKMGVSMRKTIMMD